MTRKMVKSIPRQKPEGKKAGNTSTEPEEEPPLLEVFYDQLNSLRKILCEQLLPAHDAAREEALKWLAKDKEEILKMSAPDAPAGYAKSVHEELSEFESNLMLQKKHDDTAIKMFNHYDNVISSMIQDQKKKPVYTDDF